MRKYNAARFIQRAARSLDRKVATPFPGAHPLRLAWEVSVTTKCIVRYQGKFTYSAWRQFVRTYRRAGEECRISNWCLYDRAKIVVRGAHPYAGNFPYSHAGRYVYGWDALDLPFAGFSKVSSIRVGRYFLYDVGCVPVTSETTRIIERWIDTQIPHLRSAE